MWILCGARIKTMLFFVTVAGLSKIRHRSTLQNPQIQVVGWSTSDGEVHLLLLPTVVGVNLVLLYLKNLFNNSTTIAGHGSTTGRSEMGNVKKGMN